MRLRNGLLVSGLALVAVLAVMATQARTQGNSNDNILAVLSTTDVIGYTSPCG